MSVDQIVKNTWRRAMDGWGGGRKEDKGRKGLTRAQLRRIDKRKKKNPIVEMMVNMVSKGATKYVMNQMGLGVKKDKEENLKKIKFDPWASLWNFGREPEEENEDKKKVDTDEDEPAIMTLALDKLL
jgi:hypothetical protein